MSAPPATTTRGWLAPGTTPPSGDPAGRDTRAIEMVILVVVGLVLVAAVVWDVARQVRVNARTAADRVTWRDYAHRNLKNLDVRTLQNGTTDFVCAPTVAKHPTPRLCLVITGPTRNDRRTAIGGYYLTPFLADRYPYRWGCFGVAATRSLCGLTGPPPASAFTPRRG